MKLRKFHGLDIWSQRGLYLYQSLPFHKSFEMGYQWLRKSAGFTLSWNLTTKGNHAGFHFHLEVGKFFFEISLYDKRHWSYELNRFLEKEKSVLPPCTPENIGKDFFLKVFDDKD